jgi:hypothetical protein
MACVSRFLASLVWDLYASDIEVIRFAPVGFECTPSYIEAIRAKDYSSILRNLIIVSVLINTVLSFLASALLLVNTIVNGMNVLSALGSLTGGNWLRILVLIDAVSVLLGGVMTGTVATIQLLDCMAQ